MPLTDIITEVANITGVADRTRIASAVKLAAKELWAAGEFPGELQSTRIQVTSDDVALAGRYATTPYNVHTIRRMKSAGGRLPVEISYVANDYDGWFDIQNWFEVRLQRITPLSRRITNATRLTFTRKRVDATRVVLTIGGITDVAAHEEEELIIEADSATAETQNRYTDVRLIQKSAISTSDILVTQADGTEVCFFPNCVLSSRFKLFEFRGAETAYVDNFGGVYDILYKPILPEITESFGYFPPEYDQTLIWLATGHIYMSQEDKIAQGVHYRKLAAEVLAEFAQNAALSMTIKRPATWTPFATVTNGQRV